MNVGDIDVLRQYADPGGTEALEAVCFVVREEDVRVLAQHRHDRILSTPETNNALEHYWASIYSQLCDGGHTKEFVENTRRAIRAAVATAKATADPVAALEAQFPKLGTPLTPTAIVRDVARRTLAKQVVKLLKGLHWLSLDEKS